MAYSEIAGRPVLMTELVGDRGSEFPPLWLRPRALPQADAIASLFGIEQKLHRGRLAAIFPQHTKD